MKKRNIFAKSLAAVLLCLPLAACGNSASSSDASSSGFLNNIISDVQNTDAAAAAEEDTSEDSSYEETEYDEASSEDTEAAEDLSGEEEAPQGPSMYDQETYNVLPYSDGIAWIQYGSADSPTSAAVDKDGNILFTLDGPVSYLSPFSAGYAFYVTSDEEGIYEVIIDEQGNPCWTPDRSQNEHILAGGDGVFVVERHTSGFDADYLEIGAVDANGNILQPYANDVNGTIYGESNCLDNTSRRPADIYTEVTGPKSVSRYMGEHLFSLANGSLYNPESGVLFYQDSLTYWPEHVSGGRFRTLATTYGPEIPEGTLYDTNMNMLKSDPYYYYERTGQAAFNLEWPEHDYDSEVRYRDGLFYRNHCYWNDQNEMVLHLDGYADRDMQGGAFFDGKAVVYVEGADGGKYVTVIDQDGNFLFEPVAVQDGYYTIWNNYFLVRAMDDQWHIFDTQGNDLRNVTADIEPINEYGQILYSDITDGYLTITYHNKELKMLYSVEAAVNGQVRIPSGEADSSDGSETGESESSGKEYTYVSDLRIEGKWKSTGSYGFGQAQPGAIVVFDGANCNFFSPNDTYAFYQSGDWYELDVTSFLTAETQTFTVKTIDEDHIDVIGGGGYTTELERVG